MSEEKKEIVKGKLSWLIVVLEVVVAVAYLAMGFKGIMDAAGSFDIAGIFEAVKTAIIFLLIATAVITVMCFLPAFKSKANKRIAIWNIVWMLFTIYGLMG